LLWQKGEQEESIVNLEKLLRELSKFIANLYYGRGKSIFNIDKIDEAMIDFKKALAYDKDGDKIKMAYHEAFNLKSKKLMRSNNFAEARVVIKEGLKYKPDCSGCKELLKQIEDAMRKQRSTGVRNIGGFGHRKR
jgi:tetratricopeptide (TPR) repeat protein